MMRGSLLICSHASHPLSRVSCSCAVDRNIPFIFFPSFPHLFEIPEQIFLGSPIQVSHMIPLKFYGLLSKTPQDNPSRHSYLTYLTYLTYPYAEYPECFVCKHGRRLPLRRVLCPCG